MTDVVTVRFGELTRFGKKLTRLPQISEESAANVTREFGTLLERNTKRAAMQAGIQSQTGTIYGKGIEWRQKEKGKVGMLFVRQAYVMLDSMAPHFVNVQRSRSRLLRWAQSANNSNLRFAADQVAAGRESKVAIFVKPHPFLDNGYGRSRRQLPSILKRTAKQLSTEVTR